MVTGDQLLILLISETSHIFFRPRPAHQQMGIMVKMITGDQLLIGKETAKQLGMGTNMFTTEALLKVRHRRYFRKKEQQ